MAIIIKCEDPRGRRIVLEGDLDDEKALHPYGTISTNGRRFTLLIPRCFDFWEVLGLVRRLAVSDDKK